MKKIVVWILAVLCALSGCAALAELADAFPSVTITGALTIDRDAAREAMNRAGIPAEQIEYWDGVLFLLSGTRDRLVIADEGIEYVLTQSDGETTSIAGEVRDGRALVVSSLFPDYCLIGEASDVTWQEIAAASDAVVNALNQTIDATAAAVKPDVSVPGAYDLDGEHFVMCTLMNIDVEAMYEAGATLARALLENGTLNDAGFSALSGYADVHADLSALPTVFAARYDGDDTNVTLYTAELKSGGEAPLIIKASVRMEDDTVRVKVGIPEQVFELMANYAPYEGGAMLVVNMLYGGNDYALTVDVRTDDTATMTTAFYINDMERALATEVNTFTLKGERATAVDDKGKTALSIQDVLNNRDGAGTKLLMSMMLDGLSSSVYGLLGL